MRNNTIKAIAFAGISTALAVLFVFAASVISTSYFALTALAGCALGPLILKYGVRYGFFAYLAACVIGFLLIPNKYIVFLFIAFFGIYPSVKYLIEHSIKKIVFSYGLKLVFFNILFGLNAYLVGLLFEVNAYERFPVALVFAGANFVFLCYDIAFSRLIGELMRRFGRYL